MNEKRRVQALIRIEEGTKVQAKVAALELGCSFSELAESALRAFVRDHARQKRREAAARSRAAAC